MIRYLYFNGSQSQKDENIGEESSKSCKLKITDESN